MVRLGARMVKALLVRLGAKMLKALIVHLGARIVKAIDTQCADLLYKKLHHRVHIFGNSN